MNIGGVRRWLGSEDVRRGRVESIYGSQWLQYQEKSFWFTLSTARRH